MIDSQIEKTIVTTEGETKTEVSKFRVELDAGVAKIYSLNDQGQDPILFAVQPWKTNGDGSRSEWNNEQEVIDWFKSSR